MSEAKTKSKEENKENVKGQVKLSKAEKKAQAVQKKAEQEKAALYVSPTVNAMLWTLSLLIIAAAIFGNYYYVNYMVIDESGLAKLLRVLAVIATIVVGLVVLIFTNKGHTLLDFAQKSYVELKKVIWPTRQEAVQTTFIVFVAVSIVSLFLYLCDIVFLQVIKSIVL